MQREAQAKLEPRQIHQNTGPQQRFTGGGFPLAIWVREQLILDWFKSRVDQLRIKVKLFVRSEKLLCFADR